MSQHQHQPPVEPQLAKERPSWPVTVGVISIVWASLGLLCGVPGAVLPLFTEQMMNFAAQANEIDEPFPDVFKPSGAVIAITILRVLWVVILLVAGIMTVKRAQHGKATHVIYALGSAVLTILATILAVQTALDQAQWIKDNPDSPWADFLGGGGAPGMQGGLTVASSVIDGVVSLVWPVFCLIWFGLMKKDPAEGTTQAQDDNPFGNATM